MRSLAGKKPKDFIEIPLDKIGRFVGGGTPSTKMSEYWNGKIHWTTSKRLGDALYLKIGERTITEKGLNASSTTLVPKGNVLIGTRVGVGKAVVNKVDTAISQDLTGVIVDQSKYLPEFVALQIRSPSVMST